MSETKTARVTFPNDYAYTVIKNFKPKSFVLDKKFDKVVFGWWGNTYVQIVKEDYDKF